MIRDMFCASGTYSGTSLVAEFFPATTHLKDSDKKPCVSEREEEKDENELLPCASKVAMS